MSECAEVPGSARGAENAGTLNGEIEDLTVPITQGVLRGFSGVFYRVTLFRSLLVGWVFFVHFW